MTLQIRKAERKKSRLRLGICGPAGSGKTKSALRIASGLGGKILLVDTENGSGDLYAEEHEYDVMPLPKPYTTERYGDAIRIGAEKGYDIIILDSISHAWAGEGGLLDEHDRVAKASRSGNTYMAWREITPKHNAFIEDMLSSPCHLMATMRTKTEYALEDDGGGKKKPKKIGMAPIQREGMDYEFTTVFDLSVPGHLATVSKDRTSLFDGGAPFLPSEETGRQLVEWLERGVDIAARMETERETAHKFVAACKTVDELTAHYNKNKDTAAAWGETFLNVWLDALRLRKKDLEAAEEKDAA
ncbi:MAG: AAA family ATPase [bacterium]|nr:AAA family ATPase [bacterium]